MKVSLIVFTLNEIDGVKETLMKASIELSRAVKDCEVIVVDGGSTDGTYEYVQSHLFTIFKQEEKGTNGAYKEAMELVTGEVVVLFCPDGNSIPEDIPKLIKGIEEGNDIVIASRHLPPAVSYDDDIVTRFGNWFFTKLVNILFGAKFTDYLGIYRAFRVDAIKKLNIYTEDLSWCSNMLLRAVENGLKIAEIPSDEPKRIGGIRKMRPLYNGWVELKGIWREWWR